MMGFCPYIKGSLKESECHHDGYCSECPHNTKDDTISRRAAIDDFYKYPNVKWTTLDVLEHINALPSAQPEGINYVKFSEEDYEKIAEQLRKIPIVLTLSEPEIIRCKDCKHYKFADNRAFGFPVKRCEWTGFEDVDDDDFCSRAERREE